MTTLNADGNILGRLGAIALLVAAGYGLHRLNCSGGMCPLMKTDSCCADAARTAVPAPVPAK
ncbi:MAG: hypothetical protein HYX59_11905 [Elusimicrobia bacterium]|nr:hypothetical protein [Elusimicrobiota bacterium]